MIYHTEFTLLQSMIKVFYLFKVQWQFEKDDITGVWIQCNNWNKTVTCQWSETVTIGKIPVLSNPFCSIMLVYIGW